MIWTSGNKKPKSIYIVITMCLSYNSISSQTFFFQQIVLFYSFFCCIRNLFPFLLQFNILLYNPIGRNVTHWVRVPVADGSYRVTGSQQHPVSSQLVPLSHATEKIPAHNGSTVTQELVFLASVPPLGFNTYFVQKLNETSKQGLHFFYFYEFRMVSRMY